MMNKAKETISKQPTEELLEDHRHKAFKELAEGSLVKS